MLGHAILKMNLMKHQNVASNVQWHHIHENLYPLFSHGIIRNTGHVIYLLLSVVVLVNSKRPTLREEELSRANAYPLEG